MQWFHRYAVKRLDNSSMRLECLTAQLLPPLIVLHGETTPSIVSERWVRPRGIAMSCITLPNTFVVVERVVDMVLQF